ncbi:hypothetical protein OH77DRAFT_627189 [Trametes cingulata]|nr:hypothetical protein OH77DRAFT_627189 [Trametes cingulata]
MTSTLQSDGNPAQPTAGPSRTARPTEFTLPHAFSSGPSNVPVRWRKYHTPIPDLPLPLRLRRKPSIANDYDQQTHPAPPHWTTRFNPNETPDYSVLEGDPHSLPLKILLPAALPSAGPSLDDAIGPVVAQLTRLQEAAAGPRLEAIKRNVLGADTLASTSRMRSSAGGTEKENLLGSPSASVADNASASKKKKARGRGRRGNGWSRKKRRAN